MIAARVTAQARASRQLLSNRGLASQLLAKPKEEWTYTELRREARDRGILQSGNKSALLARLQADDVLRLGQTEKSFSTSASAAAARKSTSSSAKVVAPEDIPVNATPVSTPARAAFKSSRTVKPSSTEAGAPQIPGIPTSDNPFAPKRSTPLYVAIPVEVDPPEEGPVIPVVPEKYGSSAEESASPPQPLAPADSPKVHSVSGLDAHLAAPAHPTGTTVVNPPVVEISSEPSPSSSSSSQAAPAESWKDKFDAARKAIGETLQQGHWADDATRGGDKLSADERKGAIGLVGILVSGWILGGVFAPSSSEEKH